jgi:hypothetical protein
VKTRAGTLRLLHSSGLRATRCERRPTLLAWALANALSGASQSLLLIGWRLKRRALAAVAALNAEMRSSVGASSIERSARCWQLMHMVCASKSEPSDGQARTRLDFKANYL